jgi:hypothetical protein
MFHWNLTIQDEIMEEIMIPTLFQMFQYIFFVIELL